MNINQNLLFDSWLNFQNLNYKKFEANTVENLHLDLESELNLSLQE